MNNESVTVRPALEDELPRVNELRRMVNDVHVNGRPDIFRSGFCDALAEHVYDKFDSPDSGVLVALLDGTVCGFAIVEYIHRPQSPYNLERSYYHVEEFGTDPAFRRRGVATAMVAYMRADAKARGFKKLELDMWEFNRDALAFYESVGFRTFRRYMENDV